MKKVLIILSIFVILLISGCGSKADEDIEPTTYDESSEVEQDDSSKMPDFKLKNLKGETVSSDQFKGQVLIIDFWATWCGPCVEAIPSLVKMRSELHQKGMEVIGISLDDPRSIKKVKAFTRKYEVDYPILIGNEEVSSKFGGVSNIPTMFIIDKEGNIVDRIVGYREGQEIQIKEKVEELL